MSESELQIYLERATGLKIRLRVTDNRRNMVTYKQIDPGDLRVNVHRIFLSAPPQVLRSLASFCKRATHTNRAVIGAYIEQNVERIRPVSRDKLAVEKRVLKGRCHDLEEIFKRLNRRYFKGKCDAAVTWGDMPRKQPKKSIRFGVYNFETNTIRIHPTFDRRFVPRYAVELVLYHEMLHWYIPPKHINGRSLVHTRLFREAESLHPQFEKAKKWKFDNIDLLMRF